MLDAARDALSFTVGKSRSDLDTDRILALSLVKCVEIIGEAAYHVSSAVQDSYPQVPWPNIIGMRNRLIHAYYDVDLNVVWQTITEDLPPLVAALEQILSSQES